MPPLATPPARQLVPSKPPLPPPPQPQRAATASSALLSQTWLNPTRSNMAARTSTCVHMAAPCKHMCTPPHTYMLPTGDCCTQAKTPPLHCWCLSSCINGPHAPLPPTTNHPASGPHDLLTLQPTYQLRTARHHGAYALPAPRGPQLVNPVHWVCDEQSSNVLLV